MSPCRTPIPTEKLVALWAGDLAIDDANAVEAHLFSCGGCSDASDRLGKLITGLREVIPPVISHAHRDRLAAKGTRLRHTVVADQIPTDAQFSPDVDLLVHVLRADLSHAERVDVELLDEHGNSRIQLPHAPFDRSAGEVLIACQRHYQHLFPNDPVFHVHVIEGGERRQVGTYFVRHAWG